MAATDSVVRLEDGFDAVWTARRRRRMPRDASESAAAVKLIISASSPIERCPPPPPPQSGIRLSRRSRHARFAGAVRYSLGSHTICHRDRRNRRRRTKSIGTTCTGAPNRAKAVVPAVVLPVVLAVVPAGVVKCGNGAPLRSRRRASASSPRPRWYGDRSGSAPISGSRAGRPDNPAPPRTHTCLCQT